MKLALSVLVALVMTGAYAQAPVKKEEPKPVEKNGMILPAKKQDKAPPKKEAKKEEKKSESSKK